MAALLVIMFVIAIVLALAFTVFVIEKTSGTFGDVSFVPVIFILGILVVLALVVRAFVAGAFVFVYNDTPFLLKPETIVYGSLASGLLLLLIIAVTWAVQTVDAGHVQVATLFGDVVDTTFTEGLHFPVNPLYTFTDYDCRKKNLDCAQVQVPTKDQQTSSIDFSVQYRLNAAACSKAKSEIGGEEEITAVKIIPNLRSLTRSEGKSVSRCEDLFNESIQARMQVNLKESLQHAVGDYALIEEILIRDIKLPDHIQNAIRDKKVREQEGEKQKAELERFRTEQQQKIAQAAAEQEVIRKRTLADAEAYEIEKVNAALATSPSYIRLRAMDTLSKIAKDPAAKLFFLSGDSPDPLPLMHIGDAVIPPKK